MKVILALLLSYPIASVSQNSTGFAGTTTSSSLTFATNMALSVEDMWDIWVGPVSIATVNTTVAPTPVPTSELIPPPPLHYPSTFSTPQVPLAKKNDSWTFPKNFAWGVSSAAYQVEGAVKDEGRGPSIWDVYLHRVIDFSVSNDTGDITNNHYYLYKQDIARIAALGVPYYSFSISWSRIFPFGRGPVNEQGLAHYEDVINTCLEFGVKPVVTLYHWDIPLYLQNLYGPYNRGLDYQDILTGALGGWFDEEIVGDFVDYAHILFSHFGNKVAMWFTINEPMGVCTQFSTAHYFRSVDIPQKQQEWVCIQNVLLAHSKAYHLAKSLNVTGPISFKLSGGFKIPLTNSSDDALAVQRAWDFNEGALANPVWIDGEYPKYLKEYVSTFLRNLTEEERTAIQGSADFLAHDAYTSKFYMAPENGLENCLSNSSDPLFPACYNTTFLYPESDGGWNLGPAADPLTAWLVKATDWMVPFLHYIEDTWHPRGGIAISEFGFTEPFEAKKLLLGDIRMDLARSTFYHDYLEAVLMAMSEGVNVIGTFAWSIFDNLEWSAGFNVKFGMQYVNFTTQERYYKASFFEFKHMFDLYQDK